MNSSKETMNPTQFQPIVIHKPLRDQHQPKFGYAPDDSKKGKPINNLLHKLNQEETCLPEKGGSPFYVDSRTILESPMTS